MPCSLPPRAGSIPATGDDDPGMVHKLALFDENTMKMAGFVMVSDKKHWDFLNSFPKS